MKKLPKLSTVLPKTLSLNGVTYPSLHSLCLANGFRYNNVRDLLKTGYSLRHALKRSVPIRKPVYTVNGNTYTSLKEMFRGEGVGGHTVHRRVAAGQTYEQAIKEMQLGICSVSLSDNRKVKNQVTYNGRTWPSVKAAMAELAVHKSRVGLWLKRGCTFQEAVDNTKQGKSIRWGTVNSPVTYQGITYPDYATACSSLQVTDSQFRRLLSGKATMVDGVYTNAKVGNGKQVTIGDTTYRCKTEASAALGLRKTELQACLDAGITDYASIKSEMLRKAKLAQAGGHLYVIVNKVTRRKYYGITQRAVSARVAAHMRSARSPKSKFYEDYTRYGVHSFSFRSLRTDTRANLQLLEKQHIAKYNTTDYKYGYNSAPGGALGRQPISVVKYAGVLYPNNAALCSRLGISKFKFDGYLQQGHSLRKAVALAVRWSKLPREEQLQEITSRRRSAITVRVKGHGVVSLRQACRIFNIPYTRFFDNRHLWKDDPTPLLKKWAKELQTGLVTARPSYDREEGCARSSRARAS